MEDAYQPANCCFDSSNGGAGAKRGNEKNVTPDDTMCVFQKWDGQLLGGIRFQSEEQVIDKNNRLRGITQRKCMQER